MVTFIGIISALGGTIPPVFIFPRIRNPEEYLGDGPEGSLVLEIKWLDELRVIPFILSEKAKLEVRVLMLRLTSVKMDVESTNVDELIPNTEIHTD
ncbi:hypothetical protein NQ318_020364 [Aromia moschata]|uniref:Uncharacterized protein n=1 Tax=Aromia moschata TaxID=1265417 RepID=A0AAV8XDU2_9CUCU|nr:hypothetical protein NQ318_020364 [Aromia moschata]